ncbi:MAG: MFS transporter, partial [Planctomycetota bacterium]
MLFKKDELRHLWIFYLHQILTAAFAVVWIYLVVYLHEAGFSYTVISVAFGFWGVSMFLFEVPTGAIADTLGRKASTVIGLAGNAVCILCVPFIESGVLLCVLIALWGILVTMISGASDAWVVDFLKGKKRGDLVEVYYVRIHVIMSLGFVIATVISGFTVKYFGMEMLWYINGSASLAGTILLLFQEENFERRKFTLGGSLRQSLGNMKEGAVFSLKNRNVLLLMAASAVIFMGAEIGFINWRPYLLTTGIALENLAFVSTIGWSLCALLPIAVSRMIKRFGREKYVLAGAFLAHSILLVVVMYVTSPLVAAVFYVIAHTRMAFMTPVLEPYFQSMLPSKVRATVGSFKAMLIGLAFALADGVNAALADGIGVQSMMGIAGL